MLVPTGTDMLCLSGVILTVQLQAEGSSNVNAGERAAVQQLQDNMGTHL